MPKLIVGFPTLTYFQPWLPSHQRKSQQRAKDFSGEGLTDQQMHASVGSGLPQHTGQTVAMISGREA